MTDMLVTAYDVMVLETGRIRIKWGTNVLLSYPPPSQSIHTKDGLREWWCGQGWDETSYTPCEDGLIHVVIAVTDGDPQPNNHP